MIASVRRGHRRKGGRRALRFLAGLAMLALAVTLHLPSSGPVPASPAAALPAVAVTTVTVTSTVTASATSAEAEVLDDAGIGAAGEQATAPQQRPAGRTAPATGSRAPPAR